MRHSFSALILLASLLLAGCFTAHTDATTMATPKGKKMLCCPAKTTACASETKQAE